MLDKKCLENGGCAKIIMGDNNTPYCGVFPVPTAKWRMGICPMATNRPKSIKGEVKKVNPIKASKRSV